MIDKPKSAALVVAALLSFSLTLVMNTPPAEAGKGHYLHWKQKRDMQAAEKRPQNQKAKVQHKKNTADPALKALRQSLFAGRVLSTKQLKFLADKGEGLAAVRYAQAVQQAGGAQGAAITYFAKAAALGRKDATRPFLALLRTPGTALSADDLRKAETSLAALAKSGNADAMTGLAQLYLTGTPFGADGKKALELLVLGGQNGDGDAALQAGLLMEGPGLTPDVRAMALQMYKIAASKGNLIALSKVQSLASVQ